MKKKLSNNAKMQLLILATYGDRAIKDAMQTYCNSCRYAVPCRGAKFPIETDGSPCINYGPGLTILKAQP